MSSRVVRAIAVVSLVDKPGKNGAQGTDLLCAITGIYQALELTFAQLPEQIRTVAGALLQRNGLYIDYHARGDDNNSRREISPQRLIHYRDNWYLDAFCHEKNALRSFAVERIRAAKVMPKRCRDVPDIQLNAHYASSYGIFAGAPEHTAVLRFTPERARWVADEHWHPEQQGCFLESGSYELCIPYSDPRELLMDILKYGPDVEVIEPISLRTAIMQRLQQSLKNYEI